MVWRVILPIFLLILTTFIWNGHSQSVQAKESGRLMTVYDRGSVKVFLAKEKTIGEALRSQGITLDKRDTVEPAIDQELVASDYQVNIYRARPVVVVDGAVRIKTVSPYQTAAQIAKDVGVTIYDEDIATLKPLSDYITDGAGLELTISRATTIFVDLYGKRTEIHTHGKTVREMLKEKGIVLGVNDRVSVALDTPITSGLELRVWREGKQTLTIDQETPFGMKIVYDADRPLKYRATKTKGVTGIQRISYEIEVKDGNEISRIEIANITTRRAVDQVEIIGLYNDGSGLTLSKGAQNYTDSQGVSHRETYYDLNMRVVMQSCGQGGYYTVRPDGVKVDAQGYILIAANYSNYPKCSIVETSLGLGKVYDTGGFATRYPYGFDIATDWTTADGV